MTQQFIYNNAYETNFGTYPEAYGSVPITYENMPSPSALIETLRSDTTINSNYISPSPSYPSSELHGLGLNPVMHDSDLKDTNWLEFSQLASSYSMQQQYNIDPTPHFPNIVPESSNLDELLVQVFMTNFNPYLTEKIDQEVLQTIFSPKPKVQDSFLFFSMCACAAMFGTHGQNHPDSTFYYSQAIELMSSSLMVRDRSFSLGVHIMNLIKVLLDIQN